MFLFKYLSLFWHIYFFAGLYIIPALAKSKIHVHHGVIKENALPGDEVVMDTPLTLRSRKGLTGDELCGYRVYKTQTDFPFKVLLLDRLNGAAKVILDDGKQLDYEKNHKYSFDIAAYDCLSGARAPKERIHVEVDDVNEHAPVWKQETYGAEVVEGRIYDRLLQLTATDDDGSAVYSRICRYYLLTPDVPFVIDENGYLHNTETLDYSKNHNYILEATAEDCGGRLSKKVFINIKVKPACRSGLTGVADQISFIPGSSQKSLAPNVAFELCDDQCKPSQVSIAFKLETDHIGKGCDRDTYSLHSQRKICGAALGAVDLLPDPDSESWTKGLPTDDGHASDQIFAFDGQSNAIEVPQNKLDPHLGQVFSISTWMKHERNLNDTNPRGTKEHILCNSDGEVMNRHHYSLFVHHCRLVLLLRQEYDDKVDPNVFRPAEWRWRIPEVCDGAWHHYVINVDGIKVTLYIDGKLFVESKHNPEVIDDWPLHQTTGVHFTKLMVGACYQGNQHELGHYFHGYLAGLSILKNQTEADSVIRCLNYCQEKLDFTALEEMDTGMSVSMNSEMSSITISGPSAEVVENLARKVGYVNTRVYPTPGHRPLRIEPRVMCADGKQLEMTPMTSLILVVEPNRPEIQLNGTGMRLVDERGLLEGELLFSDLVISATTKSELTEMDDFDEQFEESEKYQLDSCLVMVNPPLKLDVEHLKYPTEFIESLGLHVSTSEDGLVIAGADKISRYEDVLHQLEYVSLHPEELKSRSFTLSCTELKGRYTSNKFQLLLDIKRVQTLPPQPVHHAVQADKLMQPAAPEHLHLSQPGIGDPKFADSQQTGIGVAVVIVVCAGFIVMLIVLGVMRIRNTQRRSRDVNVDEKQEMEWDNSALTITVNPLEHENMYDDEVDGNLIADDDSDSDDDIGSYHENDAESCSEEETAKTKNRELEWDDSTLTY